MHPLSSNLIFPLPLTKWEGAVGRRRLDQQPLLRYATVPEAPLYREIMDIFTEASASYASRLSPEMVHDALSLRLAADGPDADDEQPTLVEVKARLEQLWKWGSLSQDYDNARATSLESYERTAYVYDLTPGGEAAVEALAVLDEALRRVGGLQGVALRQIEEMLGELAAELGAPELDGARIYALCEDLHTRFKSLTGNAALFMQKVNRLLASPLLEFTDFALFKADTIAYLTNFIGDLDALAGHIRSRLDAIDRVGPASLTAAFEAGEAASGQLVLEHGSDTTTWGRLAQAHLSGLAEWFRAEPDARTGAAALYGKARAAVLGITRAVERIRESSTSPSSRSADLLSLAVRFEEASGDAGAHRLWHAAFGLAPARHLGIAADDETVPASTSWWEEHAAVRVSRQLRATGHSDYVRKARQVTDRSAAKRELAAAARIADQKTAEAADTLVGLGTIRVSEITVRVGPVEPIVLRLLGSLIYRALRTGPHLDGSRRAVSIDGTLQIELSEPLPPRAAVLTATSGTWTLPDYRVCVEWRENIRLAERAASDATPLHAHSQSLDGGMHDDQRRR